jgi:hypothetical protein
MCAPCCALVYVCMCTSSCVCVCVMCVLCRLADLLASRRAEGLTGRLTGWPSRQAACSRIPAMFWHDKRPIHYNAVETTHASDPSLTQVLSVRGQVDRLLYDLTRPYDKRATAISRNQKLCLTRFWMRIRVRARAAVAAAAAGTTLCVCRLSNSLGERKKRSGKVRSASPHLG